MPLNGLVTLEIAVETLDDAMAAIRGGADRLELGSALEVGGLTPGFGILSSIQAETTLPIMAMVRPRPGGCHYSDRDFAVMLKDRDFLIHNGARGLVFGFLDRDGHIQISQLETFLKGIPDGIQTVFHRAFDFVENPFEALQILVDHRVSRILTSGLKPAITEGFETIRQLIDFAQGRIEILGGGGIRLENVREVVELTGLSQIHASCRATAQDRSPRLRPEIRFGLPEMPPETLHRRTDASLVACMRAALI